MKQIVLLIDPDGDCEDAVSEAAAREGYDTHRVRTSREAFALLQGRFYNLALAVIDVDPGAHGLGLMEAMTSCADRPPILVLTGLEESYMKPIARAHGAAACLGKPVDPHKLSTLLRRLIAKRRVTADRWGHPLPALGGNGRGAVQTALRGIAAKLKP